MSKDPECFLDLCLRGDLSVDMIDDFVDQWHESASPASLPDFLGMTSQEYERWLINPDSLASIVIARQRETSHDTALDELSPQGRSR